MIACFYPGILFQEINKFKNIKANNENALRVIDQQKQIIDNIKTEKENFKMIVLEKVIY